MVGRWVVTGLADHPWPALCLQRLQGPWGRCWNPQHYHCTRHSRCGSCCSTWAAWPVELLHRPQPSTRSLAPLGHFYCAHLRQGVTLMGEWAWWEWSELCGCDTSWVGGAKKSPFVGTVGCSTWGLE